MLLIILILKLFLSVYSSTAQDEELPLNHFQKIIADGIVNHENKMKALQSTGFIRSFSSIAASTSVYAGYLVQSGYSGTCRTGELSYMSYQDSKQCFYERNKNDLVYGYRVVNGEYFTSYKNFPA